MMDLSFTFFEQVGLTPGSPSLKYAAPQYGALCYRLIKGKAHVLLITSRDTGRWVLPKGWPIAGLSPQNAAAREAFEEAGVCGVPAPMPIGSYRYFKQLAFGTDLACVVGVYPLLVDKLRSKYPESGQRRRRWFTPAKAAARVQEPGLQELLAAFTVPGAAAGTGLPAERVGHASKSKALPTGRKA